MEHIWSEIRNEFEDEGVIFIDAWLTDDEMESGEVIAKIDAKTGSVTYIDERAKTDASAQELIKQTVEEIFNEQTEI